MKVLTTKLDGITLYLGGTFTTSAMGTLESGLQLN